MSILPMLGNLAWAPVPGIENVEVLDRFNGVPTFGIFTTGGERQLFWRMAGDVPRAFSVWLYVPLSDADESRLAVAEPSDLLQGIVFQCPEPRWGTVGVAKDYRLVFEREWRLPQAADPKTLALGSAEFLVDALKIALREDMPPARREIVFRTSQAMRELAESAA